MNPQALDSLRDIHLPASLWWQSPVWWLALALAMVLAWAVVRFVRRRKLRAALRELSALAHVHSDDAVALARAISSLLRRYATACFPEAGVAGLAGAAWLDFLDAHGGNGAFRVGAGAVLETLPYQAAGTVDSAALVATVRAWLRENLQ